jgi:hypothetical protein
MSKGNSPTYAQGLADGLADTGRVSVGNDPEGPQPPYPDYPVMYLKGYEETFNPNPPDDPDSTA